MTRDDYLKKLSSIENAIVCGLTLTYDMGFEFTVLTSEGAYTDLGNFACWPCSEHKVTDELRDIQKRLLAGNNISNEELLKNEFFEDVCTYYNPIEGTWLVEGDKLKNTLNALRAELARLKFKGDTFYSLVRLEDWSDDAFLFASKDELRRLFFNYYEDSIYPYADMEDSEVERAYNLANEAGWDAVPVFSSSKEDDSSTE